MNDAALLDGPQTAFAVEILLFGAVIGTMWEMTGGAGNGAPMMNGGHGYGGTSMMNRSGATVRRLDRN